MSKWELMTFMHVGDNPAASDLSKLLDEGWEPFATHEPGIMYFRREKPDRAKERTISKPKTAVEEIWETLAPGVLEKSGHLQMTHRLKEALYDICEWVNSAGRDLTADQAIHKEDELNSILAILKGEKARDIPKA